MRSLEALQKFYLIRQRIQEKDKKRRATKFNTTFVLTLKLRFYFYEYIASLTVCWVLLYRSLLGQEVLRLQILDLKK